MSSPESLTPPRRSPSLPRRVAFALLMLALFFAGLEGVLWGVSKVVYWQKVGRLNPTAKARGDSTRPFTIITIGDSVTAGQGTAPIYSYPRQLETLLDTWNPGQDFSVINHGVFAMNSSRAAAFLPQWLKEDQPDLVVVMTGCNNAWNYANSNVEKLGLDDRAGWRRFADHFRTYRFMRVALRGVRTPDKGSDVVAPGTDAKLVSMDISASVSFKVDSTSATLERQKKILKDSAKLTALLQHDLKEMKRVADENGTQMLVMAYPFLPPYFDHRGTVRGFAAEAGVPVADNYLVFQEIKQRYPKLDLFSTDRGHPNAAGYRVVAANVYDTMYRDAARYGLRIAPPGDPLAEFRDRAYLTQLLSEVKESASSSRADEYSWETVAHVAMELGDREEAKLALRKAFDMSRGAPQFYESLGKLYMEDGNWDAIREIKDAVRRMRSDRNDIQFLLEMFPDGAGQPMRGPGIGPGAVGAGAEVQGGGGIR